MSPFFSVVERYPDLMHAWKNSYLGLQDQEGKEELRLHFCVELHMDNTSRKHGAFNFKITIFIPFHPFSLGIDKLNASLTYQLLGYGNAKLRQ